MSKSERSIFATLPSDIVGHITTSEQREKYLLSFLENVLPSSDIKDIKDELKKSFPLHKFKRKLDKQKPKKSHFLTVRKSILLGLNKFGKKSLKYEDMLPLNQLWLEYMQNSLGSKNFENLPSSATHSKWENVSLRLLKADYHGAIISVIRSRCPAVIGITGIVIQDTKNLFRIICKNNEIRSIPKKSSVFSIKLGNKSLEVFGKELCIRSAERSVKKIKSSHIPEL